MMAEVTPINTLKELGKSLNQEEPRWKIKIQQTACNSSSVKSSKISVEPVKAKLVTKNECAIDTDQNARINPQYRRTANIRNGLWAGENL